MEILVNDGRQDLLIRGGNNCFELCKTKRRKNTDTGEIEDIWEAYKWYSDLASVFTVLLSLKIANCKAETLEALRDEIIMARREITKVWGLHLEEDSPKIR